MNTGLGKLFDGEGNEKQFPSQPRENTVKPIPAGGFTAKRNPKIGFLVVLDGPDGSGKATQTGLLVNSLRKNGIQTETLDFPQYENNTFGALINEYLCGKRGDAFFKDPYGAATIYAADRAESRPKLDHWLNYGKVVVLDRYVSANMIHQGAKIKDPEEMSRFIQWIDHVEHEIFKLPRPNLVLHLEIPLPIRKKLMREAGTLDSAEKNEKHQQEAEKMAKSLAITNSMWQSIHCTYGGELRSKGEIHAKIHTTVCKKIEEIWSETPTIPL